MLTHPRWRCGLVCIGLLLGCVPARADLDPGLQKPYDLHVVLHIAEHRALTPLFQESLERQLRNYLQLTYGKLAQVEILRNHPQLQEVLKRGLQQALDGWDDLSGIKTHFVLVDFVSGRYEIQTRQHDGFTGLSSPVVRQDATSDPGLVARKAALLVDRDFGLAGTVVSSEGDQVRLAIRGGGLGEPLERWLKPDDVFAVARFTREGERVRATRLDWTVLQVLEEPKAGVCLCRFATRYQQDQLVQGDNILGYRGLRLTTTSAPLRLRLVEDTDRAQIPLPGVPVHVSRLGFEDPNPLKLTSRTDGLVITDQPFTNVAYVSVLSGVKARFPVAIVDQETITCRLVLNPEADAREQLRLRCDRWIRRMDDLAAAAEERRKLLEEQLKVARGDALTSARTALKALTEDINSLQLQRNQLAEAAAKAGKGAPDLSPGDQRLEELRHSREVLEQIANNLERILAEENSDKTKALRSMLQRGRLLESRAEFDEAISLYKKVLAESPDQPNVKSYLVTLEKAWQIKDNPAHQAARDFVYRQWSLTLDTAGLKAALPRARNSLEIFKKTGDRLSARKLALADLAHAAALEKRLAVLRQRPGEDSSNETRLIRQLAQELARLSADAIAFTRQDKGQQK
jgi:tetratricopeptide (TPR) repeat protein